MNEMSEMVKFHNYGEHNFTVHEKLAGAHLTTTRQGLAADFIDGFIENYPSLDMVTGDKCLRYLLGNISARDEILAAIGAASCDGQFPASACLPHPADRVEIDHENRPYGSSWGRHENYSYMRLTPYVGDRHLHIYRRRDVWNEVFEVWWDYEERPTLTHTDALESICEMLAPTKGDLMRIRRDTMVLGSFAFGRGDIVPVAHVIRQGYWEYVR